MRLVIMGTAPAIATADQDHMYFLLDGPDGFWLLDCGGSASHRLLKMGYDPLQLKGMILTHGHADHIYGLPVFLQDLWLRGRTEPLPIYANAPTVERCRALVDLFIPETMRGYIRFHVIGDSPGQQALDTPDFSVYTAPTIHAFPAHALRFEPKRSRRVVVYSADTAPCANVVELARGANLLIHEASVLEPVSTIIGHSTPAEAAEVAREAEVPELLLVHSHPALHSDGQTHLQAARQIFTGPLHVARDGEVVEF
ncbi:MAG: MBL fold metallo-hydrolase [Chloroflexi bacterium]|nr:MBL fold metallo-hydrolase [Chloroflexota bacterium]